MNLSLNSVKSQLYLLLFLLSFSGCVPVFSEMQGAGLVGKDNQEITAGYSTVSFSNNNETDKVQEELGLQFAYGLSEKTDLRFRYERIDVEETYFNANIVGFGPKFSIKKEQVAFYLPVGFAFGDDIEESETWQIHPTFLFTLPVGRNFEFNPSAKALVPVGNDGDILFAFNFGAAISTDFTQWALRPEFGFLFNPGDEGYFSHLSIGVSISP